MATPAPRATKKQAHAIEGRDVTSEAVRQADAFQSLTPKQQCRQKPGMWIGSIVPESISMPCFDGTTIRRKVVPDYIDGVDRCMLELITNSQDNCGYSISNGRRPDEIAVLLTETTISITNGGSNVPVEQMPNGVWIPEMLWGELFSSSHYNEARKKYSKSLASAGTNGIGGALVNIYSEKFEVLVEDPESHRRFQQTWCRGEPIEIDGVPQRPIVTTDKNIVETVIRVTWTLDFPFFGIEKYSKSMMEVLAFHAITSSFVAKVPVTITDGAGVSVRYDVSRIEDYASLYPELKPSADIRRFVFVVLDPENVAKKISYSDVIKRHLEIPVIELLVVDDLEDDDEASAMAETRETEADEEGGVAAKKGTKGKVGKGVKAVTASPASSRRPTGALQLSYVNGMCTSLGGVHVDAMVNAFFGEALSKLEISLTNGKRHISFLLSVRVPDPKFKGNSKSYLTAPRPVFEGVTPAILKDLETWNTMKRLKGLNDAEKLFGLKKSDGKKLRRLTTIKELDDANDAGTAKSQACTLIIVEGGSAATYPRIMRDLIQNGRDTHGILLMRGKPLNMMQATVHQLIKSEVYAIFKQAVGLQDGMDYGPLVNFKKLRYGHVLIATDADCDGWHILSLILLIFQVRFPALVTRGYISCLRTPALRVPGKQNLTFYTKRAYEKWRIEAKAAGGTVAAIAKRTPRFCKGLGSSSKEDVAEDRRSKLGELALVDIDLTGAEALSLAFSEKRTGDRKVWLSTPVEGDFLDTDATSQSISRFVHTGLKLFSLDNITRAIPSVMDGLKEAMRKALVTGFNKFKLNSGNLYVSLNREERRAIGLKALGSALIAPPPVAKVFQIVALATEKYCYHHGEPIFGDVVGNMCRDHLGTNNLPWFHPVSCFGTIEDDSKPAARYASLGPAWWWSYAYNSADVGLVEHVYDEDIKCEPHFLLPVACWALCNHADGVGTGYSTRIVGHNIEEIVMAHLCLLDGRGAFPPLIPWWRGFRGSVSLVQRSRARKMAHIEQTIDESDFEEEEADAVNTGVFEGGGETDPDPKKEAEKKAKIEIGRHEAIARMASAEKEYTKEDPMVCVVDGVYSVEGTTVIVTALPLRSLKDFKATLALRIEQKIVADYRNATVGDNVRFEIEMCVDPVTGKMASGNLMRIFRLRRIITMSNMVLLDERGLPRRFKGADDILNYFHGMRLEYYGRRLASTTEALRLATVNMEKKLQLVKVIVGGEILYHNRPRSEVLAEIDAKLPGTLHSTYIDLKVSNLSVDEIPNLEAELALSREKLAAIESTPKEKLWKTDLLAFLKEYRGMYGGVSNVSDPYKVLPW